MNRLPVRLPDPPVDRAHGLRFRLRNLMAAVVVACWVFAMLRVHAFWPGVIGALFGAAVGRLPAVHDRAAWGYRWLGGVAGGALASVVCIIAVQGQEDSRSTVGWSFLFAVIGATLVELMLSIRESEVPRGPWQHETEESRLLFPLRVGCTAGLLWFAFCILYLVISRWLP